MHCAWAILSSLACHALQYLPTLSHKRYDFFFFKLRNTKCVFWFSLQLLSETFLILRRNERDMIKKCMVVFTYSTHYSCPILMKLKFSRHIFEKSSNIKFHENPSNGSRVVTCAWTNGQTDMTEANNPVSQFCERASKCCRGPHNRIRVPRVGFSWCWESTVIFDLSREMIIIGEKNQ